MAKYSEIDGLPKEFFEEKRTYFLTNLKKRFPNLNQNSILVLQGADGYPKYDSDTTYYYFDQEPNFYYLTGVRYPHMKAVIDIAYGKCDIFYEKADDDTQVWQKVPTKEDIETKYGIPTHYMNELYSFIQKRNMEVIYILSGTNANSGLPVISAQLNFTGDYEYLNKRLCYDDHVYMALCECRMIKTYSEQELLRYIGQITADAHREMMKTIKPGMNEREMENCFMNYLRKRYYTRFFAYASIAASGRECATLHYMLNNRVMQDGELFLSDQGIKMLGYDSDITTTFPVNGKFTPEQKKIYDIALASNIAVKDNAKAGKITKKELDNISKKTILKGLKDIGILTENADIEDLFNKGMARIFMPHSFGHYLGIDTHDVGPGIEWSSMQLIRAGMFITDEPGVYFIKMLLDEAKENPDLGPFINFTEVDKYYNMGGVRIEDNLMIYDDHIESFTFDIPRTTEEIEEFMAQNNPYVREHQKQ